ncbi:MAG: RIP metalloprotease RseP [Verrucomicrobia bacterium]|nr:RIP metalloprotease RseP [Verrucomicrobiota bacterium]
MFTTLLLHAYTLLIVLLLFGVTIFIHELGHFLVARWCGLQVDAFSIGFGPAIWKRTIKGVEYKICLLPFGGYVALPQMDPAVGREDSEAKRRELPPVTPGKKILVGVAGVIGNMILAILIAYIVYWGGQSYAPPDGKVVLGYVETNSAAYAAGARIGDQIESVSGKPVGTWEEFLLATALGDAPELRILHPNGEVLETRLPREEIMGTSYIPGLGPLNYVYVLRARPGSSAEAAGLRNGDRLLVFDGVELYSREQLVDLVNERPNQTVPLLIERGGEKMTLSVTPAYDADIGRTLIGIEFNTLDVKPPWAQIKSHAMLIVRLLKALTTPREAKAAAGAVGGPVAILTMFWFYVQGSFIMALWFTCLLNVNLAVLNLLPIPVLDGGHIALSLGEMIARRPASPRVVSLIWNVSAVLLIALFLMLTWRDVNRFFVKRPGAVEQEAPAVEEGVGSPAAEAVGGP